MDLEPDKGFGVNEVRGLFLSAVLFLLGGSALISGTAQAVMVCDQGPEHPGPVWATSEHTTKVASGNSVANETFLNNLSPDPFAYNPFGELIGQKKAAELRQNYILSDRSYEERHNAGLSLPMGTVYKDLESSHNDDMHGLSQSVWNEVQGTEGNKAAKRAEEIANQDEDLKSAEKPVAVAGVLYGLYADKPFTFRVEDSTTIVGHTNLRAQTGSFSVNSSSLDGISSEVDFNNHGADPWSPTPVVPDPTSAQERYRVSVSKPIPALAMSGSLAYGATSNSAIASLSRPIVEHLTCVVDSVYPLDDMGGTHQSEQRLKFFYHLDF